MAAADIEGRVKTLIANIKNLDANLADMPFGKMNETIIDCNSRIKKDKQDLSVVIERLTKLRADIDASDVVLNSVVAKIRNTGAEPPVRAEEPNDKKLNWADETDRDEAERKSNENVWVRRAALRVANEVVYRTTPVANSIFSIPAVHVDNIDTITSNARLAGVMCYIEQLQMFFFYTPNLGLIFGNGLVCNPPGMTDEARMHTIMCSQRKRCRREKCRYAHNPLDTEEPSELRLISAPHYNSRQDRNSFRNRNRDIASSIPFLDVSELDGELINVKYDNLHRFGRLLMNWLIISTIIAGRRSAFYMSVD